MTVAAQPRPKLAAALPQGAAVAGGAIVFLLATAGLANAWLAHQPMPEAFRSAAVVTHLSTVLLALPLGISQLVLPKGTLRHRTVGYVWVTLMTVTALVSFAIHGINPNGLSWIHIFSVTTLVFAPLIVLYARRGQVEKHRASVLGLMLGGLVVAGLFTFIPGRALGQLVFRMFGLGG
jgi:uncharacterized membrane protein